MTARLSSVRVTLTHDDINVLMGALAAEDEYIRDYEGAQDPYRGDIERVTDKLQAARGRMHRAKRLTDTREEETP